MTTEKFIYFVRHGESEANNQYVFQSADDPLTPRGHEQAACLAERFRTIPFTALIASPFDRARATAEYLVRGTGVPLMISELWREYVPPRSVLGLRRDSEEGMTYVAARRANLGDPEWHYEDEENYFDLHVRAGKALEELRDKPDREIVVITHLGFLKAILTYMLNRGDPDPELYVKVRFLLESKNTGITTCRYGTDKQGRPGWRILTWNDYTHLPDELASLSEPLELM